MGTQHKRTRGALTLAGLTTLAFVGAGAISASAAPTVGEIQVTKSVTEGGSPEGFTFTITRACC